MSRDHFEPNTPELASCVLRQHGGTAQIAHAAAIMLLPSLAVLIAGWQIWFGQVEFWQPALAITLYAATMTGITVGFHRMLAHRAFRAHKAVRLVLIILGCMAAQGPPIYWVSNHRRHHQFGDTDGDPHSPYYRDQKCLGFFTGLWHAHIGWTFTHQLTNSNFFCKDILRDKLVRWTNRHYYTCVLLGLAIPSILGSLMGDPIYGALNGLLWGGGVRIFITYHLTNSINSVSHTMGYRSFDTPECSRNNLYLSLPTFGEAWHNNHHAFPSSAIFGFSWWEIDLGGLVVRVLELFGLVENVRRPNAEAIASKSNLTAGKRSDKKGTT